MIPDFGESDVLHLNLPLKYILSAALKNHEWPLWNPYLANGFPLLAEGQIGTFYLPNLLLFRFLPLIWAYNLNLVLAYLLMASGTYFFSRKLGLAKVSAFFASFIFTFSGYISVHLNHFNSTQSASLMPWIFWAALYLWKKPSLKSSVLLGFLLSQQIFSGYVYIVFITIAGITLFISVYSLTFLSTKITSRLFLSFLLSAAVGFGLSAIQLLPTVELWQLSQRQAGLDFDSVTQYPYPFSHLITFISPYALGNPATGTYPRFNRDWGIFWENTAYVGILPLMLAFISLIFLKNKTVKIFLPILFISLLLVLGKNSPLYFIFGFLPFNLFRVPSKYLLLVTFMLSLLSSVTIEQLWKFLTNISFSSFLPPIRMRAIAYICISIIFLLIAVDEYKFSYQYPPATPANWWSAKPEIVDLLPSAGSRVSSSTVPYLWNKIFLKDGWGNFAPFVYLKNGLYPDYNAFFSMGQTDVNTGGLIPRRLSLFTSFAQNIGVDKDTKTATVGSTAANALSIAGVNFVISPFKITHSFFSLKNTLPVPTGIDMDPLYLYENKEALPRSYLVYNSNKSTTVEDVSSNLADDNFLNEKTVFVEDDSLKINREEKNLKPVKITSQASAEIQLQAESKTQAILVLADTNYPGWKAYIDDVPAKIYDANLTQRGILFPAGNHKVKFIFRSDFFEAGKKITLFTSLIVFLAVFLSASVFPRKASRTGKKR